MIDFAVQRMSMVESQLRPSDITDRRILRAFAEVRREAFLPDHLKAVAYMDEDIRLGSDGRIMLNPRALAKLIELARIEPGEHVLEIGAGTGFATAILARLAGTVTGVEARADLAEAARRALQSEGVANASIVTGALVEGHPAGAPYDAILVNGAIDVVPPGLLDQLKDGGRLVAVDTADGVGRAVIWHRHGMHFDRRTDFDAHAPVLPGFERRPGFTL